MNREQLEESAKQYGLVNFNSDNAEAAKRGFMAGALWRINSVWHNANEKPDKNQLILFECRKTYGKGYSVNFGENHSLLKNVLLRWAYVKDLLPEGKEETK